MSLNFNYLISLVSIFIYEPLNLQNFELIVGQSFPGDRRHLLTYRPRRGVKGREGREGGAYGISSTRVGCVAIIDNCE